MLDRDIGHGLMYYSQQECRLHEFDLGLEGQKLMFNLDQVDNSM